MTTLTLDQLKQIVDANGKLDGWDFSRVRIERTPRLWKYVDVVRQYLKPTDKVLDVGTGGGEVFLSLASDFKEGVGVDQQAVMIETAERNRVARSIENVLLLQMEASDLRFAAESFDVVLLKHLHCYVDEIVRVLRPGGYFVCQMVGPRTTLNFLEAFGWTPASFGPDWWQTVDELAVEFRTHGCHVLAQADNDVPYWFKDVESFLFYLMAVPWPEKIVLEKRWQQINYILETAQTERGIVTNEHRGLLVVQKL